MVGVDTPLQSRWIAMQTQIIIFMIERTRGGGGVMTLIYYRGFYSK